MKKIYVVSKDMRPVVKNNMVTDVFEMSDLAMKLKKGSLALFPTDTLPAICAFPKFSKKIWSIKKRPSNKPLILMGGRINELFELVKPCAIEDGLKLANLYWPGALTIVLPTIGNVSKDLNFNSDSVGFRVPALKLARDFLNQTGPLATTSANISGKSPVKDASEASIQFPGIPILGPVPWPNSSGVASTVIEWKEGKWKLLRSGAVALNEM